MASSGESVRLIGSASSEASDTVSFTSATAGDVGIMVINTTSLTAPTGWTRIINLTRGSIYANTMAGGETSATFPFACDQIFVAFFRGCAEPSSGDGTYSGSIADPDCPITTGSAVANDMVLAITAASYTAKSVTASVPSGYTEILYGANGGDTRATAMSYIVGQTGQVNPPVFDWNLTTGTAGSTTILLVRN